MLHVVYEVAQQIAVKNLPLTGLRLRLPNGEEKIPHGGLALLVEVGSDHPDALMLHGKKARLTGRMVLRGGVLTPTGRIGLGFRQDDGQYEFHLPVAFSRVTPLPGFQAFRGAHEVEFVVLKSDADPWNRILDEKMMESREPGVMTVADLVDLLGGPIEAPAVQFTSEGGLAG